MSTYYVPDDTKPGDSLHYSDLWATGSLYQNHNQRITLIDLACYGDYDNSCAVERSNQRVILGDEELAPHLVMVTGSHGSSGIGYLGAFEDLPEDLCDTISALADYPCLSDEDHSDLESEMESEAWEDNGRDDFKSALAAHLDEHFPGASETHVKEHDLDIVGDDEIDEIWHAGCDAYNVNRGSGFQIESGGGVYFYIGDWIARASIDPDHPGTQPWAIESQARMAVKLALLERETGYTDDDSHACLVIARDAALEGRDVEVEAEDCIKQARGE